MPTIEICLFNLEDTNETTFHPKCFAKKIESGLGNFFNPSKILGYSVKQNLE